jgi:hypothetical protein
MHTEGWQRFLVRPAGTVIGTDPGPDPALRSPTSLRSTATMPSRSVSRPPAFQRVGRAIVARDHELAILTHGLEMRASHWCRAAARGWLAGDDDFGLSANSSCCDDDLVHHTRNKRH